jgi:hypothetical protein
MRSAICAVIPLASGFTKWDCFGNASGQIDRNVSIIARDSRNPRQRSVMSSCHYNDRLAERAL